MSRLGGQRVVLPAELTDQGTLELGGVVLDKPRSIREQVDQGAV
jgi:hypothetical protein